jgi:hypothetical protein
MSINPLPPIEPAVGTPAPDNPRATRSSPTAEANSGQSDSGTYPKEKDRPAEHAAASSELPQDEVQVQRDSETNGEIVIRYLDHSGNLIVQMPSSQMLAVTRSIDQDFRERAKDRENKATPEGEAGGNHGD